MAEPEYLQRLRAWKARFMREQDAAMRERSAARGLSKEQRRAKEKALRQPPARVWRIGRTLLWEAPSTADQLKPIGYWVCEQLEGGQWTSHADRTRPEARDAYLYGDGPARVETVYHQQALGERYYSDAVSPGDEPWWLVHRVRSYASEKGRPAVYYERWRRTLAAFGVVNGKRLRGRMVTPLDPPMTAAEARGYAARGWGRWAPVADYLEALR